MLLLIWYSTTLSSRQLNGRLLQLDKWSIKTAVSLIRNSFPNSPTFAIRKNSKRFPSSPIRSTAAKRLFPISSWSTWPAPMRTCWTPPSRPSRTRPPWTRCYPPPRSAWTRFCRPESSTTWLPSCTTRPAGTGCPALRSPASWCASAPFRCTWTRKRNRPNSPRKWSTCRRTSWASIRRAPWSRSSPNSRRRWRACQRFSDQCQDFSCLPWRPA